MTVEKLVLHDAVHLDKGVSLVAVALHSSILCLIQVASVQALSRLHLGIEPLLNNVSSLFRKGRFVSIVRIAHTSHYEIFLGKCTLDGYFTVM